MLKLFTVNVSSVDPDTKRDAIVETPVAFRFEVLNDVTWISPALISTVVIVPIPDTFKLSVLVSPITVIPIPLVSNFLELSTIFKPKFKKNEKVHI